MAASYLSRFLRIMRTQEGQLTGMFRELSAFAARELARAADADGVVPVRQTSALQRSIGDRTEAMFVGTGADGQRAPYILLQGQLVPQSQYMRILWTAIQDSTRLAVEQHASIMERHMSPSFVAQLRAVQVPDFTRALVFEIRTTNPFAEYDPAHRWVDPNGYRLDDRIWNTSTTTRRKIDRLLAEGIKEGKAATTMAKELEVFLKPGRTLRTKRPYGTTGSYDALRLARTETTRAHAAAQERGALANPFIQAVNVVLSHSHPKPDICDTAADLSPFPKDAIPSEYAIPLHPHCLCHYTYEMLDTPTVVEARLKADVRAGKATLAQIVGPLKVDEFIAQLLLGKTPGISPIVVPTVVAPRRPTPSLRPKKGVPPPKPEPEPFVPGPKQPVAAAPAPRPLTVDDVGLETAEGEKVRKKLLRATTKREKRLVQLKKEADEITATIDQRAMDFGPKIEAAGGDWEKERALIDAQVDANRPLTAQRRALVDERNDLLRSSRATNLRAIQLPKAKRSTMKLMHDEDVWGPAADTYGDLERAVATQDEGMDFVNKITAGESFEVHVILDKTGRASANRGFVKMGVDSNTATAAHEVAHNVEYARDATYRLKRMKFFESRTAGDTIRKLKADFPTHGYGKDEIYKKDKWQSGYTGRIYAHDSAAHASSEVITMGVQHLYEDAAKFAREDPEFFDFIISYLRRTI